jgi:hypothetical protein
MVALRGSLEFIARLTENIALNEEASNRQLSVACAASSSYLGI